MKIRVVVLTTVVWLAMGFVLPAAKTPPRPFYLPQPVTLDGAEVPQGMYQLKVEEGRSGVHVELWKEGRFVAAGNGAWVKGGTKYKDNAILFQVNPDGSRSLIEIRLAGSSNTIVLRNDASVRLSAK
jgi:hypothetical protein